ncbi:uncharacterized protein FOMMEDRAFT_83219 [Fomitiporia mediterranea MF3/22]|uniref:uncharacterized protein n=1 Tax=Fomitiporia mediterranea (strain MF3/22) TaxID=694068 RepID=UPI000440872A|nr:uncharacterized protein FOMMEDRAFT_83219 [Fomitiporia mediterranea MF3/22]EJD04063.1 hypothetical protein FOMMEDRAFT_83219 [Fomitiporia mediterranea MF3/22]
MTSVSDPRSLLGLSPFVAPLLEYLEQLTRLAKADQVPAPEVKSYSDALYHNYYTLGISLMFVANDGSKSIKNIDARSEKLALDSIDIYNPEIDDEKKDSKMPSTGLSAQTYSIYPGLPLVLSLPPSTDEQKARQEEITLSALSTGKDIVGALGEPDRKGGGAGPSSGSIGIWCEWAKDGIMVEFGGPNATGPQAWERGKEAKWKVLTLFWRKT